MNDVFLRPQDVVFGGRTIPFLDRGGRGGALVSAMDSLEAPALAWVIGPPGSGKGRLAIEITRALAARGWDVTTAGPDYDASLLASSNSLVINALLGAHGLNTPEALIADVLARSSQPGRRTLLIVRASQSLPAGLSASVRTATIELAPFAEVELRDIGASFADLNAGELEILAETLRAFEGDRTPFFACTCADVIQSGSLTQPPTFEQCLGHFVQDRVLAPLRDRITRTQDWACSVIVRAAFGLDASGVEPEATRDVIETFDCLNEGLGHDALRDPPQPAYLTAPSIFWLVHYLAEWIEAGVDERPREPDAVAALQKMVTAIASSKENGERLRSFLLRYIGQLKGQALWSPLGMLLWSAQGQLLHDLMPVVGSYAFVLGVKDNAPALRRVAGRVLQSWREFGSDGSHSLPYLIFCLNISTAIAQNEAELDEQTRLTLLTIACSQLMNVEPRSTAESYCATVNQRIRVSLFAAPDLAVNLHAMLDYDERTSTSWGVGHVSQHLAHSFSSVSKVLYVSDVGSDLRFQEGLVACVPVLVRLLTPAMASDANRRHAANYFVLSLWRLLGIATECVESENISNAFRDINRALDAWQALIPGTKEHDESAVFRRQIERVGGFPAQVLAGLAHDFGDLWRSAAEADAESAHRGRFAYFVNVMIRLISEARARASRNYAVRQATKEIVLFLRSGVVPRARAEHTLAAMGLTYD